MLLTDAQKEQIKLRAGFINNMANGVFITGVLGPILAVALSETVANDRTVLAAMIALVCLPIAIVLHLFAWRHLLELDR